MSKPSLKVITAPHAPKPSALPPDGAQEKQDVWRDSSIELMRGLDVVELAVDVVLDDLPGPPISPVPGVLKRP